MPVDDDPVELSSTAPAATLKALSEAAEADDRPMLDEPPPVKVLAVRDVELQAADDELPAVAAFYAGLLGLKPLDARTFGSATVDLRLVPPEGERDSLKPLGLQAQHYKQIVERLQMDEVDFEIVRGLVAGGDTILLRDPAGNWVGIGEWREVR
jgi:hypothetical protein